MANKNFLNAIQIITIRSFPKGISLLHGQWFSQIDWQVIVGYRFNDSCNP
jgi:hypothetical protein